MKKSLSLILKDIKSAKWAVILVTAYFVILKKYFYSLCPLVILTGFPCPGCGLTRSGFAVLRFDFLRAWEIHPFIYPIIVLAGIFFAERYVLYRKKMTLSKWTAMIIIAGMVVFYIWRMIYFFPDVSPMTYYYNNYLHRLLSYIQFR